MERHASLRHSPPKSLKIAAFQGFLSGSLPKNFAQH
jgi:hypothetical protein